MSVKEQVYEMVEELSPADLEVVARMLRGLREPAAGRELDAEVREWMDADLGEDLPPYDWGDMDPLRAGDPVWYVPGIGFVSGPEEER